MNPWLVGTPFGFSLDLSLWGEVLSWPAFDQILALLAIVGWAVLALVFFYMGEHFWLEYRRGKYTHHWQWVLLATDVPPLFIQTPKAVEQIFAHLSGAKVNPNIGEKYWLGKKQKYFSFEIISIEGYIQFLIRTEVEFRDLVEAAIYAQYPEAEITEVEDYVGNIPGTYPSPDYNVFGLEFHLADNVAFPIRTYPSFEYSLSKEAVFSDPMAAILENFARIGHGEHFWFQIIIEPAGNSWKAKGIDLVKKIIANKKASGESALMSALTSIPDMILKEIMNIWNWSFEPAEEDHHKEEMPGRVTELSPGVRDTVAAIEEKIAKIGFKSKIRVLYAARQEVFNPSKCLDGFVGSLNQFHIHGRNAIVPYSETRAFYAFKTYLTNWKKSVFVTAFKKRKMKTGVTSFILNIEELATIWHYPLPFVKTPLVTKAVVKKAEPPVNLPVEAAESPLRPVTKVKQEEAPPPPPPEELPYG